MPGPCPTDGTDVWLSGGECPLYSPDCCGVDDEPRLYDRLPDDERPPDSQGANGFTGPVPGASVCGLIVPGVVDPGAAQSRGGSNAYAEAPAVVMPINRSATWDDRFIAGS